MTTTLEEAMASGASLDGIVKDGMGIKSENGSSAPPPSPTLVIEDKASSVSETINPDGFSPAELSALGINAKGSEPKQEEKPNTIGGTPYITEEALAEGYKNQQRENDRLRKSIQEEQGSLIAAGVKEELNRLLAEVPPPVPQESDEEKALKADDPEAYDVLQLKKQVAYQNHELSSMLNEIRSIKQGDQIRQIHTEFKRVSAEEKVPLNALMAYGSLRQYAQTSPKELAQIVKKELGLNKPGPTSKTVPVDTTGIRSPATGGTTGIASTEVSVEDMGELGSSKFKQFEKKMVQVALNRMRGGAN